MFGGVWLISLAAVSGLVAWRPWWVLSAVLGMGPATSAASVLSKEVSPLVKPDFASARLVVRNLEDLAGRQTGNEKVRTQRLATVIRNLFTAEFRLGEAKERAADLGREARTFDRTARDWRKPNAFGRTNPDAAREAARKAAELRKRGDEVIQRARMDVLAQAREFEVVMRNFHDLGELDLVIRMAETLQVVLDRTVGRNEHTPAFSEQAIAAMRQLSAGQEEWRFKAVAARDDGRPEEALRFFLLAGDLLSAQESAAALTAELLEAGLAGSAIEACELAGDLARADELRAAHPDPPAAAFRRLDADALAWRLEGASVRVVNGGNEAAGFFCGRDGRILTLAAALTAPDQPIRVRLADERVVMAQRVAVSAGHGLAMVRVALPRNQFLLIARPEDVQAGVQAALPDFERGTGAAPARLSNPADAAAPPAVAADPGIRTPGAPVVDHHGRVLGLVGARGGSGPVAPLIPAATIRAFLGEQAGAGFSFH